jgi:hypothetical protein
VEGNGNSSLDKGALQEGDVVGIVINDENPEPVNVLKG